MIHDVDVTTECPNCDRFLVENPVPTQECIPYGLNDLCMLTKTYDENGELHFKFDIDISVHTSNFRLEHSE